ncbi:MAG: aldo/keto reductase [Eubacteriales bacterium]|nr:aldo/keto reductase [Eubacteriales bacterium]
MEYRQLPHGLPQEKFSVLGIGMGGIQNSSPAEIETVVRKALDHGINFFDLGAGGANVYAPFGRAIAGRRNQVFFQLHFGAVYNDKGEYGWSRDLAKIQQTFNWELMQLGTNYVDMGFLHCVDEKKDVEDLVESGVLDYIRTLKKKGTVRHIGFSSHNPEVAEMLLDTKLMDMMMFSLNPAYDLEKGDELGIGTVSARRRLLERCQAEGVGISVMKPFHGGKLLSSEMSPFRFQLTIPQLLQYAFDRPGVLTVLPGVRGLADLNLLLDALGATPQEKDYSVIGSALPEHAVGSCVYCAHCQPCPKGIQIGLMNKYYDLARGGDVLAADHYRKLEVHAEACIRCGRCDSRCPFGVKQSQRMQEIARYFGNL